MLNNLRKSLATFVKHLLAKEVLHSDTSFFIKLRNFTTEKAAQFKLKLKYAATYKNIYIWQCMCVCVCVCMFAMGARTLGARGLKFGTELGFHPESVFG